MKWLLLSVPLLLCGYGIDTAFANASHSKSHPKLASQNKQKHSLTASQKTAALSALKSLRRLQTATQVGVSYINYSSRLIDSKSDVDEAIRGLPDGPAKNEITAAADAFTDARITWGEMNETQYYNVLKLGSTASIFKKYSVPIDLNAPEKPMMSVYSADGKPEPVTDEGRVITEPNEITDGQKAMVLSVIWDTASSHIKNAEKTIK